VRVQLDPDKVASLGLTLDDIRTVIGTQTVNAPKGSLSGPTQAVVLNATDQIMNADAYSSLVVAYRNGAPIRVGDLGRVIEGPEDNQQAAWFQDKRAVIIDVEKLPGANALDTTASIKAKVAELASSIPASAQLHIVGDRTQTIQASVSDVEVTMMITVALVVLVIFSFLRNLWATIIPSLTIPLSLLGTFAAMYLLGYSLDNLSLMGLTVAVGFVVDDAIVVIENISRHRETGQSRLKAAIDGAREVSFTIISMTVSLIAVFIPILLMGGIVGRLFREFAVTVSVAIVVSGFISLSVTPMLCAKLIPDRADQQHGRIYGWSERLFEVMLSTYRRGLDVVLRFQVATLAVTIGTLAAAGWLYFVTPKGFFPQVDTGLIMATAQGAPDVSYDAMSANMRALAKIVSADPDVDVIDYWIGANPTMSQGRMTISLKPASQRSATASQVLARIKRSVSVVPGVTLGMQVRQDIQVGGRSSAAQYQYTLQDADVTELATWAEKMRTKLSSLPQIRDVTSDRQAAATSAMLDIDRGTAARLGVSVQAIDEVLYDAFGQRQVATLFTQTNQYHVVEEVNPRYRLSTGALAHLFVRSSTTNQLVPLGLLAKVTTGVSPISINHQSLFPAVTLSFNLAPGVALGDAVTAIQTAAQQIGKPDSVFGNFQGTAQAFQSSLANQPWLILAAVIAVYIVLGVLYESPIHPLTIISTLPSAGIGALLALNITGNDLSIMGMFGIILLIGIVKKNAIMMVDFAVAAERKGISPQEAIRQACLLRFRPIMMTTMAALLGALPLALGTGAGSELRAPLGIAIVGGLVVSQILTLFTTPVVYLWFDRLAHIWRKAGIQIRPSVLS
jgi:multidrug efflux pump